MPRLLTFTLIAALGSTAFAEDCFVSTNPPKLVESYPGVAEQYLDPDLGAYSAILENGDLILVQYGRCELSKTSSYHSHSATFSRETLTVWVEHLIPSSSSLEAFRQQVASHGGSFQPGDEVIVEDDYEGHSIRIKLSENPDFRISAHYEWLPPRH